MSSTSIKLKSFEFLTGKFIEWLHEVDSTLNPEENFSKLKLIKLNFFVSAVDSDVSNDGLLNVFNNFFALPYGHVESDIFDHLSELKVYALNKNSISIFPVPDHYYSEIEHLIPELEKSVASLKDKNPDLITYPALDLVELSHTWYSWKTVFSMARRLNKYSLRIPIDVIKRENKIFSLKELA